MGSMPIPRPCLGPCGQMLELKDVDNPRQSWRCQSCRLAKQRDYLASKERIYTPKALEYHRWYYHNVTRYKKYGLTKEQFAELLEAQDHKCAICLSAFEDEPHVDHDHKCCGPTKACDRCRRGLLCHSCNTSLGGFADSEERLLSAIDYLRKHRG